MVTRRLRGLRVGMVGTILGGHLFFALESLAEMTCPTAIKLEGSTELVGDVAARLGARGIAGTTPAGCAIGWAWLAANPTGIDVSYRDPWGRTIQRHVRASDTAAALLESWVRADFGEILDPMDVPPVDEGTKFAPESSASDKPSFVAPPLQSQSPPSPKKPPLPTLSRVAPPPSVAAKPAPTPSRPSRTPLLELGPELTLASDGSLWLGASTVASLPVGGRWVPGLVLRGALDTESRGDTAKLAGSRNDIALGVRLGYALHWGGVTIVPAAELGFGRYYTATDSKDRRATSGRTNVDLTPIEDDEQESDDAELHAGSNANTTRVLSHPGITESTYGPRIITLISGYVPLFSRFSWALSAGFEVAPLAHSDAFTADGAVGPGEPAAGLRFGTAIAWGVLP